MKKSLFLFIAILLPISASSKEGCVVAIPDDCPKGKVCAKYNSRGETKCIEVPGVASIVFDLPISSSSNTICSQSGRFSMATHVDSSQIACRWLDMSQPIWKGTFSK